jgi:heme O synthase-like polyprenyltransferase
MGFMDDVMSYYHYALGIATILILAILWTVLNYTFEIAADKFYNMTPTHIGNYTVNQTEVRQEYSTAVDVFFYSVIFMVLIVLIWIVRKTTTEKETGIIGYS